MSRTPREPRRENILDELADLRSRIANLEHPRRGYAWDPQSGLFTIPGDLNVGGAVSTGTPDLVHGLGLTVGPDGISIGVENLAASAGFTIPEPWTTYDLIAHYAVRVTDVSGGSTGAEQSIAPRLRLDGAAGPSFGTLPRIDMTDNNDHDVHDLSGVAFVEAETVTGARTVDLFLSRGGGFSVTMQDRWIVVYALRTS